MNAFAVVPTPEGRQRSQVSTVDSPTDEAAAIRPHPHVLIVEDDPGTAALIRAVVMRHGRGLSAAIVRDGLQAMRYLRGVAPFDDRRANPEPDLVILDLVLPGISGFQVLTWMDNNGRTAHSPVVVFSGSADPEAARRAYALGARAFLPKSANPVYLAELVRDVLSHWASEARDGTRG